MSRDPLPEEIVFDQALDLPEAERAAFVERICAGDPALRASVETLLAACGATGGLDRCVEHSLQHELADGFADADLTGATLGPYLVTGRLGEGGTALVYRAEQHSPLRRSVALKVIKPGMDTREVLSRFSGERHTLALMDHPGIARVLDAGLTTTGRGYFVMELVEGVPLTRYCDEHRLTLAARLALFLEVCDAVQHAHQKGVIHRDLKPSNILVAVRDAQPRPKIIDFGIAKAVSPAPGPVGAPVTQVTQLIGTPGYMSPEQASGGSDLDTRSDIYSLGVLLHELLTGRTPHQTRDWARTGVDELRRRIREEDAPRPGALLRRLQPDDRQRTAATRATTPDRLIRALTGDLDWITLRCLEKDPDRRYPTAAALADDLRRHGAHEPVSAAAPGRLYLLRKSFRRHRVAYAFAATTAVALLLATTLSLFFGWRAHRAEVAAEANAAISRATLDFVRRDLLAQASPERQPDRDLKLRTALDHAAQRIGDRFAAQPLAEAAIRDTLGTTYTDLGDYESALVHQERVWRLLRDQRGEEHRETLAALNNWANTLRQLSRFAEAERLAGDLLERQRRVFGPRDPQTLDTLASLGAMRLQQGREREAEALLREALEARRAVLGEEDIKTLQTMNNLANCLASQGREAEATPLFEQSLATRRRRFGAEHPATLNALNSLAGSYSRGRRAADAADLYRQVHALRLRVQGPDHPDTLSTRQNLGSALMQLGQWDEAAAVVTEARRDFVRVLGPENPTGLMPLMNLGIIRSNQGRYAEAEAALRECLEGRRKILGPVHAFTTDAMTALAETLGLGGRPEEAEALFRNALEIRRAQHGADSLRVLDTAHRYGAFLRDAQRLAEADAILADTFERARTTLGVDRLDTLYIAVDAVGLALLLDRPALAEARALTVIEPMRQAHPGQPKRWLLEARYAAALLRQGRSAEAAPLLHAALDGMTTHRHLLPPNELHKLDEVRGYLGELP